MKIRRVKGHSLEPQLRDGQLMLMLASLPEIGDFAVAKHNDREIIKLVSKIDGKRYLLVGKDESHSIGWINRKDIIGKAIKLWPR